MQGSRQQVGRYLGGSVILVVPPLVDVTIVAPEALVLRVARGVEFGHAGKVLDGIE